MTVNLRTTIDPNTTITVSIGEYIDLLRQGLVHLVEGGSPIDRPDFTELQYNELADPAGRANKELAKSVGGDGEQSLLEALELAGLGGLTAEDIAQQLGDPQTTIGAAGNAAFVRHYERPVGALGNNLTKVGIVIPLGEAGDFDEDITESLTTLFCPENGRIAGVYTGYKNMDTAGEGGIGLAWSDDGVTWEKTGLMFGGSGVPGDPDEFGCTGPLLVLDGGLYHLFYIGLNASGYEGGGNAIHRLCHATSPSLITPSWTRHGVVLEPGGTGWRESAVYHASILSVGGTWYNFINAADADGRERIGYATAADLAGPWTFDDVNSPLIDVEPVLGRSAIAGDPSITRIPGGFRMDFFRAGGGSAGDYYATTTDALFPLGWELGNGGDPILTPGAEYDSKYAHKPFITHLAGRMFHYYTAVRTDGLRQVALAVDPPFPGIDFSSIQVSGASTAERLESLLAAFEAQYGLQVFPAANVYDSFNRANGALGTTDIGDAAWIAGGGAGWAIANNVATWTGSTDGWAVADSGLYDNYDVSCTFTTADHRFPGGLVVRGSSETSHVRLYRDQTNGWWALRDIEVGGASQVTIATAAVAAGDVVRCRVQGTTYTLFINDVQVAQWTGFTYHNTAADTFQGIFGAGGYTPQSRDDYTVTAL